MRKAERKRTEIARLAGTDVANIGGPEENVKYKLIIPLLKLLDYKIDEMSFEYQLDLRKYYRTGNKRVDIAILLDGLPRIIVEIKSYKKNLEKEIHRALVIGSVPGIETVLLTNGREILILRPWPVPSAIERDYFRWRYWTLESRATTSWDEHDFPFWEDSLLLRMNISDLSEAFDVLYSKISKPSVNADLKRLTEMMLTVTEVSSHFGIKESTVCRFAKNGDFPSTKIFGKYWFNRSILNEWIIVACTPNCSWVRNGYEGVYFLRKKHNHDISETGENPDKATKETITKVISDLKNLGALNFIVAQPRAIYDVDDDLANECTSELRASCSAYRNGRNCWEVEDSPCCHRNKTKCDGCLIHHWGWDVRIPELEKKKTTLRKRIMPLVERLPIT